MPSAKILVVAALAAFALALAAYLWTPDKPLALLEQKYLRSPTDYLEAAGIRLHVRDAGPRNSTAVVMLHDLGSSLHTWEPWANALSSDQRVVRYDLPGFGLTGPDPTNDYSEERGMQILAELLDKLSIKRAILIGNSMGGRLAWNFAARHPDRVEKLVLISPDGFRSAGFEYGKAPKVPLLVKAMQYVLPKPLLRANLLPAYADPNRLSNDTVDRYYDLLLAPGIRTALIARTEQTVLTPPEPILHAIIAPTLLLWGEQDKLIPIANAADYLKAIPHAKLVRLPSLGHVPQEEDPKTSLSPVEAFLKTP